MSYVKTVWQDLPDRTTPITAARLNNLETQYDKAVTRSAMVNVREFGALGDGIADDAAAIQAALDASPGVVLVPAGEYALASAVTVNKANTVIRFESGARFLVQNAEADGIVVNAAGVTISGGEIVGPGTWDGTNTAWTFALIRVAEPAGTNCTIDGVKLRDVPKVGIGVRADGAQIRNCRIEGNYPAAQFTGVETAHFGITLDPPNSATGGAAIVSGNSIFGCVTGVNLANFGAGSGLGYIITGNTMRGCHDHGIYHTSSASVNIVGNSFVTCRIPIVVTGRGHVIASNSLYTSSTGGNLDATGISVRDPEDVVIDSNTIIGDATDTSVAIAVDSLTGTTIRRVAVTNNVINQVAGSGAQPAIRVGTTATEVAEDCRVDGNLISAPGRASSGVIDIRMAVGFTGESVSVCNNTVVINGDSFGIALLRQRHAVVHGNSVRNGWSAPSAATQIHVYLESVTDSSIRANISVNVTGLGTNIGIRAVQEGDSCDRNVIGPNTVRHDGSQASSTEIVQTTPGNASLIALEVGELVAASAVGTLANKLEVRDGKGAIVGYVPVYTTIT